jgi:uncharacterized protein
MNVLIAGGSGFIGAELINTLSKNHNITVLGRTMERLVERFPAIVNKLTWENLTSHDAQTYDLIINLSGSSIGAKRWSKEVKRELIESRTLTNKRLIEWLIKQEAKPRFFCANAVGIYGAKRISGKSFGEDHPIPTSASEDFLQHIALAWEESLKPAIENAIPVTTLRFGVVLKKGQGMLKKLELPFRCGLGSILGEGNQVLSWVDYQDLVNAVLFLLERPKLTGSINITAPHPVNQKEFALQFAKILKRPLFLKTPSWFINALFGEMGEYLLLRGQKVVPKRLTELGFKFTYPNLETALKHEYQG